MKKEQLMAETRGKGQKIIKKVIDEISRAVVGKDDIKELLLLALLSQGHVLIEGLPGTAKTTIARTFAHAIGGTFKRVQGTPDMLPSDILGFYLYRGDGSATFMPGPIFANVLLADELNRTTPRTQSALLESMQEQQVTIERETHKLGQPFIVIASQIPYGGPGTSQLSEVQTDRFMFRTWSGLPTKEEEDEILKNIDDITEPHTATVAKPADIIKLQHHVKNVHVSDSVRGYILEIIDNLRHHHDIVISPSPRASIALLKGAKAKAFLQERDFIIPDDVKSILVPALSHRIQISPEAEMEDISPEIIINEVATQVPVPKMEHA
jgi:MoxR-like ATPase